MDTESNRKASNGRIRSGFVWKPTAGILGTLLAFAIAYGCNRKEEGIHPALKDLTEAVYASGSIYPRNEYKVLANADGTLQQKLVSEGDSVRRNQLLFVLEGITQGAREQAAANIYRQSQANLGANSPVLAELEAQVRTAQTRLANDSVNYSRFRDLYQQNATSKAELERAQLAYQTSRNDYAARRSSLQRTRNQLYVDLQNSRSQYVATGQEQGNTRVRSFVDGKVYEILKEPGEVVRRNDQLALIGSGRDVFVKLAVDESDFGKIRVGQAVMVKADVYPDKVFKARVRKIYPKLNRVDQSFRVDADFEGELPDAYYGLTVEANIIISQNNRVLTIPKSYVVGNDSVWVTENGDKKKVKIVKGAENFDLVQVKGGLNEKSVIVNPE
ncbi:efflux RND transporter periplasmic adaptor subunit [Larkinella knui]|uniref:HlyD family efflux transporter periplasmic adaptor subunit n=1 Tax=Larkinella knui TaxID=2025310 RepID=A0A3P1CV99_9BACT|nr:efflux RND transporter periplasmic adaptor subunit [Larkinella knui]RRB17066.1 HlyD family efflux transporter periplasmic adaptor subunit [Larkinella knui]